MQAVIVSAFNGMDIPELVRLCDAAIARCLYLSDFCKINAVSFVDK